MWSIIPTSDPKCLPILSDSSSTIYYHSNHLTVSTNSENEYTLYISWDTETTPDYTEWIQIIYPTFPHLSSVVGTSEIIISSFILNWIKFINSLDTLTELIYSGRASYLTDNEYIIQHICSSAVSSNAINWEDYQQEDGSVHIFGYGSLVWKHGILSQCTYQWGSISSYIRRFHQGSPDHRGTPLNPGRVATLLPTFDTNDKVYGIVFTIPHKLKQTIFEELFHREQAGYIQEIVPVILENNSVVDAIVYRATPDNVWYLGESEEIALDIYRANGPSGSNREYLFNLHKALEENGFHDSHLQDLVYAIEEIQSSVEMGE